MEEPNQPPNDPVAYITSNVLIYQMQQQPDFHQYRQQYGILMIVSGRNNTPVEPAPFYNNYSTNRSMVHPESPPVLTPIYGRSEQQTPRSTPESMPVLPPSSRFVRQIRRNRHTTDQLEILENRFKQNDKIDKKERIELSKTIKLSEHQIGVWFKNKRARLRKNGKVTSVKSSK